MKIVTLSTVRKGEFFRRLRKGEPSGNFYIRGNYCRMLRKYEAASVADVWGAGIALKGTTQVVIGETY